MIWSEVNKVLQAACNRPRSYVLATMVSTKGSSYRKQGACMLVDEDGSAMGAVSGGCIEKEVIRRSREVFSTGKPTLVEYDGRYRLGCNGTVYILIEPFDLKKNEDFWDHYFEAFEQRKPWKMISRFEGKVLGSAFQFDNGKYFPINDQNLAFSFSVLGEDQEGVFVGEIQPSSQLYIIGNEWDAFKLAKIAVEAEFQVTLIGHPQHPLPAVLQDGYAVKNVSPADLLAELQMHDQTAIVLMTHSYSRDLSYLLHLLRLDHVAYLGLLGPKKRRESLLSESLEHLERFPGWLGESLRGPTGLDIGAELPGEIAVSILAEILSVLSGHPGAPLVDKKTNIHDKVYMDG